jgi:hypothetical protein
VMHAKGGGGSAVVVNRVPTAQRKDVNAIILNSIREGRERRPILSIVMMLHLHKVHKSFISGSIY